VGYFTQRCVILITNLSDMVFGARPQPESLFQGFVNSFEKSCPRKGLFQQG
jgi:hypothetical protein